MFNIVVLIVQISTVHCLIDSANLIWYEKDNREPQYYYSSQTIPEGLIKTHKIIVNQEMSILSQVKFAPFDNLEDLRIDFCKVKEILPGAFAELKAIKTLSLTGNNIVQIDAGVFNYVQVKNLNFSNNYLTYIHPQAFDNMTLLQVVVFDYNQLKTWTCEWFFNSPNVWSISIRHNLLEELQAYAFENLGTHNRSRINLNLSYNNIQIIHEEAFYGVLQFDTLNLAHNKLQNIKVQVFENVTFVGNLNLRGNPLACFPKELLQIVLQKVQNSVI